MDVNFIQNQKLGNNKIKNMVIGPNFESFFWSVSPADFLKLRILRADCNFILENKISLT